MPVLTWRVGSRRPLESAQYPSIRHTERLAPADMEPSVGRTGDSCDNALAEAIIGRYKTEVTHPRGPCKHPDAVECATLEWVGLAPPAAAENHRRHPAGGEGTGVPSPTRRVGHRGVTRTKRSPAKPGRSTILGGGSVEAASDEAIDESAR